MAMIENICGTCSKRIQSPEVQRGSQMKCPTCGDGFIVGVDAPEIDEDSYGVSGGAPAEKAPPKPSKPAAKSSAPKAGAGKKAKPAADPNLPPGKVECPTCSELTPSDREQCAYCGDLLAR